MTPKPSSKTPDLNRVLVRYGEIGLKSSGVRRHLENLLVNHIKIMLKRHNIPFNQVSRERGRIFITTSDAPTAAKVAAGVFGVVSTSPVWTLPSTLEEINKAVSQLIPPLLKPQTSFAVRARRIKAHPFTSQELAAKLGSTILEKANAAGLNVCVNLDNPDFEIHVEVRQQHSYLFTEIIQGPGGLPYGSQGTIVALHSGGIDSPVAQWLLMKRGCHVIPIYLDSSTKSNQNPRKRAIATSKILAKLTPKTKPYLIVVPFREAQELLMNTPFPKLTCILCKRMMYRIATKLAQQEKAVAIVTGENLGQVASQTLSNLTILDQATPLPVFRPLIGMDKTDTMHLAQRIGTYEASISDTTECFAVPQQPSIQGEKFDVEKAETSIDVEKVITKCLDRSKRIKLI
ncbi:MAG: tRNA uracil 4-sulfurtransferase ThiI [Promethearchaeota archaeon]